MAVNRSGSKSWLLSIIYVLCLKHVHSSLTLLAYLWRAHGLLLLHTWAHGLRTVRIGPLNVVVTAKRCRLSSSRYRNMVLPRQHQIYTLKLSLLATSQMCWLRLAALPFRAYAIYDVIMLIRSTARFRAGNFVPAAMEMGSTLVCLGGVCPWPAIIIICITTVTPKSMLLVSTTVFRNAFLTPYHTAPCGSPRTAIRACDLIHRSRTVIVVRS